jgi:lipoyl(octanoyl) transferase
MKNDCRIHDLGLVNYEEAYALQKACVDSVINGGKETLILCEHPSILTVGRLAKTGNILVSEKELEQKGIRVLAVDRGGDVTLHCPGQLVAYPILNLHKRGKDIRAYLGKLEEVAIDFLRGFDIVSDRFSGRTGVWLGTKKIVSIGVGVRRWVSFHGMAVNINPDLRLFSLIRPCGLDVFMTSMQEIKGKRVDFDLAKKEFVEVFCRHFSKNGEKTS